MIRRALVSGTVAAILSTLVVTLFSMASTRMPASGTNASSQWIWGEDAHAHPEFSLKYTLVGFCIHHASSLFWACAYEFAAWRSYDAARRFLVAAAVTLIAYVVDYHVVPARLSPGFHRHISVLGMFAAYTAFGVGLWLPALYRAGRERYRRSRARTGTHGA